MPDFSRVDIIKGETLVAVAARIGKTRLIDNVVVSR
jgi:pantothenate synthetase